MNTLRHFALALVASIATSTLPAAVLVTYDFQDTGNLLVPSYVVSEGIEAGLLGTNNVNTLGSHLYGSNRAVTLTPQTAITGNYSVSQTLTNATYLSARITVEEGWVLSFDSISLQAAAGGNTSYRAFYVFSDRTGFTAPPGDAYANVLLFDRMAIDSWSGILPTRAEGLKDYEVSLSAPVFQNIVGVTGGTEVEFRIYVQTASTGQSVDFGVLTFNGTLSPVPEPAASAMLLPGVLALLGRRARLRRD